MVQYGRWERANRIARATLSEHATVLLAVTPRRVHGIGLPFFGGLAGSQAVRVRAASSPEAQFCFPGDPPGSAEGKVASVLVTHWYNIDITASYDIKHGEG